MVLEIQSLSHLQQYTSDPTKVVVIDFYADWCGPCKHVAPLYANLANSFPSTYGDEAANNGCSVVFLKCNVDRCRDVASHYKVTSMPTFIFIHEGKEIERFAGADIGRVERVAKANLAYASMQRAKAGGHGTSGGSTLGSSASTAATATGTGNPAALLNAAARHLTNISTAITAAGGAAAIAAAIGSPTTVAAASPTAAAPTPASAALKESVEKLSTDLLAFLKSQTGGATPAQSMPLGTPLIPFLLCDSYAQVPHEPLEVFFKTLVALGRAAKEEGSAGAEGEMVCKDGVCSIVPPAASSAMSALFGASAGVANSWAYADKFTPLDDAIAIITNIVRIAVNALSFETWHVQGAGNVTAHTVPNPMEMQMQRMMQSANSAANNNKNKPAPPAPYKGRWHTVLLRLLRCETVLKVLFTPSFVALGEGGVTAATAAATSSVDGDISDLAKAVMDYATPSPLILSKWMKTGKQLELNTLLGSLLSPGFFPARASTHSQQIQIIAMLNPSSLTQSAVDPRQVRADIDRNVSVVSTQIHNEMDAHVERCFPIFRELMGKKGAVRTNVLQWLQAFFAANAGFTRQNREKSELCSDSAMLTLSNVLVELALPIINNSGFEKTIPTDYYRDLNAACVKLPEGLYTAAPTTDAADEETDNATAPSTKKAVSPIAAAEAAMAAQLTTALNTRSVVHFGLNRSDVERVCHFKPLKDDVLNDHDEVETAMALAQSAAAEGGADTELYPLPTVEAKGSADAVPTTAAEAVAAQGVNHYAPRVHIFFMALRAISLSQAVVLNTLKQLEQQISHPRTSERDRPFLMCLAATHKAMVTNDTMARKTVQFLNGAARWLLHILGADRETGQLPAEVPEAWKLMPQTIIDEVLTALTLVTKYNVRSLHPSDIDDIISLFLVLMGNLAYFPKAHTHALFPTMILELLNSQMFAPALTRHRWYQSNIVLGCVRTYIAMEKCYYDKTSCRYYLSVCLKKFLAEDVLCYPARQTLQDTTSRTLEKFTHMVTTEANQAIDDVLTALTQMRVLESEGKDVVAGGERSAGFTGNNNNNNNRRRNNRNNRNNNGANSSIYTSDDEDEGGSGEDDEDGDNANNNGGAAATASNNNVRSESYPQLGERLKNGLLIFNETIAVFKLLSRQFKAGVLQHMVAQQISNMLVQNIAKLAGKNSAELKVKNPELWNFNPRATLDALVDCFVAFKDEKVFIGCVLESMHSVTTPDAFDYALLNITNPNRTLVVSSLAHELSEMRAIITNANVGRELEELIWDDEAPEYAFCALMSTPLKDPVALPMPSGGNSIDDLIFVERDVIRHRLLELEENPFSRQKLTEQQLNAYNAEPEVKKAVDELKAKISAYATERRAALVAAKQ